MIESRHWFILVVIGGVAWLLFLLAPVVTPFAASAALAYLGDPLVDRLQRFQVFGRALGRTLAVVVVFAMILLGLGLLLLIIVPNVLDQVRSLVERVPAIFAWLVDTALPWLQTTLGLAAEDFDPERLKEAVRAYWKEAAQASLSVIGTVSAGGQAVLGWMMNLLLIPVVTFYLLRDWDQLVEGARTLLPRGAEPTVSALTQEIDAVLGAFMRGQLMVMLALGLVYSLGLWLIGLDFAFIIGMGAGLLSIVPYLGTVVGLVAAVIAALFQFQDLLHPALALAVFGFGQVMEGMVLTPKLVGDRVGLHPVAVIFAVLAGGQLFGFLGVLLALPAASALNVLARYAHARYRGSSYFHEPPGAGEGRASAVPNQPEA